MTEEVCLEVQICCFFTRQRQEFFAVFGRARVSGLTCFSYNAKKSVTAYIYVTEEVCLEVQICGFVLHGRDTKFLASLGERVFLDSPAFLTM